MLTDYTVSEQWSNIDNGSRCDIRIIISWDDSAEKLIEI